MARFIIVVFVSTTAIAIGPLPAASAADSCAIPPVQRIGDALVVTWRKAQPSAVVYRLDDVEGYWLFPPTNDATVALTLPAAVRGSFNLSIVQETGTDGTVRVCPPQPHRMPVEHVGDPSEIPGDAVHLAPATFVSEPLACGWLDRPARVVNAVAPTVPRSVSERGITGDVRVRISLDENSELTDATIIASPSSLLNDAALESARQTTFEAEQFRCAYVPAQFMFIVSFGKRS